MPYFFSLKKVVVTFFLLSLALVLSELPLYASARVHHEIKVILDPESSYLEVEDRIILPSSLRPEHDGLFHFLLHDGLLPQSTTAGVVIERVPDNLARLPEDRHPELPLAHYTVKLPLGLRVFFLKYRVP